MTAGTRPERRGGLWVGRFSAMAGPCEVQLELSDSLLAAQLFELVKAETQRIEAKYSRYRDGSLVAAINSARGQHVAVDEETAGLLDLAERCHELSGGLFDITAGVLRRAWRFDGSSRLPSRSKVKSLLPLVGWDKVEWRSPKLWLAPGMEIDLGGLGKEYAVDRCHDLLAARTQSPFLVNFGGDLRVNRARAGDEPWRVAVEDPRGEDGERLLELRRGALTTSGDSRRFLLRGGRRYSHVLNPRTGWPVRDAPRSVSVAGGSCLEAGLISTLALLHGREAEDFLVAQGLEHWVHR